MSVKVRIKLNRAGVRKAALQSEGVKAMLAEKAAKVAAAAEGIIASENILVDGEPGDQRPEVSTNVTGRGVRARAYVNLNGPDGQAVEAKHSVLARAIDAAG